MTDEQPPSLPHYPPAGTTPVVDRSRAKPLLKMISRMIKPRMRMKGKGKVSDSDVHIKEKKIKYW